MTNLHDMTALEQAAAVKARQVSPAELVEHYLDRIARLDGQLGAFVTVTAAAARDQAAQATRQLLDGAALPPLHGVPLAVKDLNATKGVATKLGSRVFADWVPDYDDNVVVRMRQAGTISLGKTSVPEIGLPCYTEPAISRRTAAHRERQRRRGIDPHPGQPVRSGRPQADPGPDFPRTDRR